MCTMWIDGFNGVAQHLLQNVDFVVAAAAEPAVLRRHARSRGWRTDDVALTSTTLPDGTVTVEIARRQPTGSWRWVVDRFAHSAATDADAPDPRVADAATLSEPR